MTNIRHLWALLVAIGTATLIATSATAVWSEFQVDVQQEAMHPKEWRPADHLEPSQQVFPESYYLIEFAAFPTLGGQPWLLRVSLNSNKTAAVIDLYTNALPFVSKVAKDHPFLRLSEISGYPHRSRDLDLRTAAILYRTWVNVLLESHYSKTDTSGLDGVGYHFGSWVRGLGWLYGGTWSPDADLPPRWLTETGFDLRALVDAQDADVPSVMARIADKCDRTMKYLKRHGRL